MFPLAIIPQGALDVLEDILKFWEGITGSWGVAIILLTFTIRLAILPLTFRSVKSMQKLQVLQPEIKKIQERFKEDRQRMNQEMMKFYQENKVNPLGSCLPILLQIPFFITLFELLRSDNFRADIRGEESFLFIPNLAEPATGLVLVTLIVLYVATQLGASLVTAISADRNQRLLVLGLPFLFVAFIWSFETGLLVYWITTNVWTVGQQLVVRKFLPPPEPLATAPGKAKEAADGGKPSWFERLAGMAAQPPAPAASSGTKGSDAQGADGNGNGGPALGKRERAVSGASAARPPRTGSGGGASDTPRPRRTPPSRKKKKRSGRRR
jgi:YidC/Oxa1 family membrane protein insertase